MRRSVLMVVLVVGLVSGVGAAAWRTVTSWLDRPLDIAEAVELEVPPGATFRAVAQELKDRGVLLRPELLTLYARKTGQAGRIKAGTHVIAPPVSPRQLVDRLVDAAPRRDRDAPGAARSPPSDHPHRLESRISLRAAPSSRGRKQ